MLAMIVKDTLRRFGKIPVPFTAVLESTLQLPYRSIIVVDDGSDGTGDFIKRWGLGHGKEVVVTRSRLYGYSRPTRATARQTAIDIFLENFGEEWLMFLDDDCVLNPGWWREAEPYTREPRVGIIWGLNWDSIPEEKGYLKILGIQYKDYLVREFYRRGGMHDTMLRRPAIKDLRIPPELHVFEDWYILRHVLSKGWEARIVKTGVTHYNPGDTSLKEICWAARLAVKYGIEPPSLVYAVYRFLRSLAGTPVTVLSSVKAFGPLVGVKRGLRRQLVKITYRACYLKNILVGR